jgi:chemotaxis protein CheX
MRIEYINPFVESSLDILQEVLDDEIMKEELYLKESSQPVMGVAVFIGVTGSVKGRIIIDLEQETAIKISSAMNFEELKKFDELVRSTITELANMIVGRAITKLHALGFTFLMTPPAIFTGKDMEISNQDIEAFIVPLITKYGKIEINVAVKENTV